jgi:hypothetical protein
VRPEAELAEDRVEEAAPLGVVGFLEVEEDRNVVADVKLLDDRGGGRGDDDVRDTVGVAIAIRGGGRGSRVHRGMGHGGSGRGCERVDKV